MITISKGQAMSKMKRTTKGLRDILFDEIEELRSGDGDPTRALAVANLAKQIINVAKVELQFHEQMTRHAENGVPLSLGSMELGSLPSSAASAGAPATEH